jgi:hypothetical protein
MLTLLEILVGGVLFLTIMAVLSVIVSYDTDETDTTWEDLYRSRRK